jgi:hypothetical protein
LLDNGLRVDLPGNTVNRVSLTPEQHRKYTVLSGRYIRDDMGKVTADPAWQRLPQAERVARFEQIKRDARADARADLGLDGLSPPAADAAIPPPPPGFLPAPPPGFVAAPRH